MPKLYAQYEVGSRMNNNETFVSLYYALSTNQEDEQQSDYMTGIIPHLSIHQCQDGREPEDFP